MLHIIEQLRSSLYTAAVYAKAHDGARTIYPQTKAVFDRFLVNPGYARMSRARRVRQAA